MANLIYEHTGVHGKILGRLSFGLNLFVLDNGYLAKYVAETKRWHLYANAFEMKQRIKFDEEVQKNIFYAIHSKR